MWYFCRSFFILINTVLGNITGALVVIDRILYDITKDGGRDPDRTDVTIRAFDTKTMSEVVTEKLSKKLDENRHIINRLYGDYDIKVPAYNFYILL